MSKRNYLFFLVDAIVSLERIEALVKPCNNSIELRQNSVQYHAVLRFFGIIGEVMRLLVEEPALAYAKDKSWPVIIAFRNIVIHEYFGIDHEQVFAIATQHVPLLRKQLEQICFDLKNHPAMQQIMKDAKTDLIKNWEKESAEYVQKMIVKLYGK